MENVEQFEIQKDCNYKDEHYLVRDNGAVLRTAKEGKRPRPLDNQWTFGTKDKANGYMTVSGHRVHIIVATAFYGPKDSRKFVVDHIDTNRCNNRVDNLRWLTKLENILLNPITRAKIEYICGSVERFLNDPSILRGHDNEDNNFSWMRTVSKEEAQNTLANWEKLISAPRPKAVSSGPIGEWVFGKPAVHESPIAIEEERQRKAELEEKRKIQKEEQKAAKARQRLETSERIRNENKAKTELIINTLISSSAANGWSLKKRQKGSGWTCDLLISSGSEKVGVKVMKSGRRCDEELQAMASEGIRGLWLGDKFNFYGEETVPSFEVMAVEESLFVVLHDKEKVSLSSFIKAFVEKRVNIRETINASAVKVRFVCQDCYACGARHWVYIGLGCYENETFFGTGCDDFDPVVIRSVRRYLSEHPELGYRMGEVKERHSNTMNESYTSFGCPECDALVGEWYLRDMFMDYIYEADDENVHRIELDGPISMQLPHWTVEVP